MGAFPANIEAVILLLNEHLRQSQCCDITIPLHLTNFYIKQICLNTFVSLGHRSNMLRFINFQVHTYYWYKS